MFHARWAWLGVAALVVASCSKDNVVTQNTTVGVGEQCGGPGDPGCGEGSVCALGYCRHGCTTDVECPQGALCVGDTAPFGCSLPSEISCSSAQPCESEALTCGIDGVCRLPCEVDGDCSRNEHHCIAGTCVGENESTYENWSCNRCLSNAGCDTTRPQCSGPSYLECNVAGPGWVETKSCGTDACSLPEGRCLEHVATVESVDTSSSRFTLLDDELYWFDLQGTVWKTSIEPGGEVSEVLSTDRDYDMSTLAGPFVGVVKSLNEEGYQAVQYRVPDGTVLQAVTIPLAPVDFAIAPPLPTDQGLYLFGRQDGSMAIELWHLSLEPDSQPQLLGPLPGTQPAWDVAEGDFCTLDGSVYIRSSLGALFRASPEGLEGPLVEDQVDDIWCTADSVLVATPAALLRYDPSGDVTTVIEQGFSNISERGGNLFSIDGEGFLHVVNLASAGDRSVLKPQAGYIDDYAVDDDYVYFVSDDAVNGGRHIVRGSWE